MHCFTIIMFAIKRKDLVYQRNILGCNLLIVCYDHAYARNKPCEFII